jgi:hypothetical protein
LQPVVLRQTAEHGQGRVEIEIKFVGVRALVSRPLSAAEFIDDVEV